MFCIFTLNGILQAIFNLWPRLLTLADGESIPTSLFSESTRRHIPEHCYNNELRTCDPGTWHVKVKEGGKSHSHYRRQQLLQVYGNLCVGCLLLQGRRSELENNFMYHSPCLSCTLNQLLTGTMCYLISVLVNIYTTPIVFCKTSRYLRLALLLSHLLLKRTSFYW